MNLEIHNIPDIVIDDTVVTTNRILHKREFKDSTGPSFNFSIDATVADGQQKIDTTVSDIKTSFNLNLQYWNARNQYMASYNFEDPYFRNIVDMGIKAVPLILEKLKETPSSLVHALDQILPGVVNYENGYIPIEEACKTWISILTQTDRN